MSKIAVIYWTGTGNTEEMAELICSELTEKGQDVTMLSVDETDAESAASYDKLALGCPAMGDEVLEEDEFQPFYDELKPLLGDKPLAIFGSYSWNEGEWMENWTNDCRDSNLNLVADGVACYEAPDDDEKEQALKDLAEALNNA